MSRNSIVKFMANSKNSFALILVLREVERGPVQYFSVTL